MTKHIFFILSFFLLLSCADKPSYTKHAKGFEYLFFDEHKTAPKPRVGDVMILNMDYYFNDDSLLFSSKELGNPFRMKLKRTEAIGETIDDALSLLHVGDSVSFKVNASIFYASTKKQDIPLNIKQTDQITFYIRLKEVVNYEQFQQERKKIENDSPETEKKLLEHYIQIANIKVKPQKSGLYFIEELQGTGAKAQIGNRVTIQYSGYFVNGESFSSTYESGAPFTFTLGKDDLIQGFQEGISMMQKGGRYTLIIPSNLGYGQEGNQKIPANKTLIFEIDVLNIE